MMAQGSPYALGCLGFVLATGVGGARADILYDALYTTTYTGIDSHSVATSIGGMNVWGGSYDMQSADDFSIDRATTITSVTIDVAAWLNFGDNSLPDSMLVEFFSDTGASSPSEMAFASVMLDSYASVSHLAGSVGWGSGGNGMVYRIGLDISGSNISLDTGTWWVAVTAVSDDNWYTQLAADSVFHQTGGLAHARDGGLDHGNGSLPSHGSWDWIPHPTDTGDLAMRIEGIVPAPGSVGVVGLLALMATRRRGR